MFDATREHDRAPGGRQLQERAHDALDGGRARELARQLRGVEIALGAADAIQVDRIDDDPARVQRNQPAVRDRLAERVAERAALEHPAQRLPVRSARRAGETGDPGRCEVVQECGVRARQDAVRFVDQDDAEVVAGPARESATLKRLDGRHDDRRGPRSAIGGLLERDVGAQLAQLVGVLIEQLDAVGNHEGAATALHGAPGQLGSDPALARAHGRRHERGALAGCPGPLDALDRLDLVGAQGRLGHADAPSSPSRRAAIR